VRRLTGVDTDRLPEERARGISITLGYARLDLPSGRRLSVIDVPGHERFVHTMLAGATGVDLFPHGRGGRRRRDAADARARRGVTSPRGHQRRGRRHQG